MPASPPPMPEVPPAAAVSRWRWAVAILLTFGPLQYTTIRTIVVTMAGSRLEYPTLLAAAVTLVVIWSLTLNLRRRLPPGWGRRTRPIVLTGWVLETGIGIALFSGDHLPRVVVGTLFAVGTLGVPWCAWLLFDRTAPVGRLWQGAAALVGLAALNGILMVSSMRGDTTVDFAWRWSRASDFQLQALRSAESAQLAGFAPTADDFPQFLGPARTAEVAFPEGALADWSERAPRELWRLPMGSGWSGFAVMGDFAVTQEQRGELEYVACYRLADGRLMWSVSTEARFESPMGGSGPRATPAIAPDGRVYAVGGTGRLQCIDGHTGRVEWSADLPAVVQGQLPAHGVCGSPLIDDARVIVAPPGAPHACLAAFDRINGTLLWKAGEHSASYSSPMIATLAGRRQLLLHAAVAVVAHDPETGALLWQFPWSNDYHNNCSQPVVIDAAAGRLLVSTGYGQGAALIEVRPTAGDWTVNVIWTSRNMKTKFTTPVRIDNAIYGLDDGILACIDLSDGARRWKAGRYGHGQILRVGRRLLVQAENGDVALVDPQPEEFIELGRWPVLHNKTWNNPAVAGRLILLRNAEEAVCLEWPNQESGAGSRPAAASSRGEPGIDGATLVISGQ